MPSITSIVTGFSNDECRAPYAYALLSCGHSSHVALAPSVGTCMDCGRRVREDERLRNPDQPNATVRYVCPHCGGRSYGEIWSPSPHVEADRLTKVGDVVDCTSCTQFAANLAALEAIDWSTVSHTRFRPNDSRGSRDGYICVYLRDHTSPTGVKLGMTIESRPEVDAILSRHRGMSPLSPTEAL